jgi:hypothetical protein
VRLAETLERVGYREGSDHGPGTLYIIYISVNNNNSVACVCKTMLRDHTRGLGVSEKIRFKWFLIELRFEGVHWI